MPGQPAHESAAVVRHEQRQLGVHRRDLVLDVKGRGAIGPEEGLVDVLLPEVLVATGHGVPGRRVAGVEAEEEAVRAPQRAELRHVASGPPLHARAIVPGSLVAGQERGGGLPRGRDHVFPRRGRGRGRQGEGRHERVHAVSPRTRAALSW